MKRFSNFRMWRAHWCHHCSQRFYIVVPAGNQCFWFWTNLYMFKCSKGSKWSVRKGTNKLFPYRWKSRINGVCNYRGSSFSLSLLPITRHESYFRSLSEPLSSLDWSKSKIKLKAALSLSESWMEYYSLTFWGFLPYLFWLCILFTYKLRPQIPLSISLFLLIDTFNRHNVMHPVCKLLYLSVTCENFLKMFPVLGNIWMFFHP